jgi:hypothetical protein
MVSRGKQSKTPEKSAVTLAVAAVEGNPSVMDMPMTGFNHSPGALDLPDNEHRQVCSRCGRPAVDRCPGCGCPLCSECVAGDEG